MGSFYVFTRDWSNLWSQTDTIWETHAEAVASATELFKDKERFSQVSVATGEVEGSFPRAYYTLARTR